MSKDPEFKTQYTPQQQQIMSRAMPLIQQLASSALAGQAGYNVPNAPQGYNVPDARMLMPDSQWYQSMSPEVMQGLWKPYKEGASQYAEQMMSQGSYGSARGGVSGSAATALGKYGANAASQVGQQAWNMTYPGRQAQYQAQLGQAQTGFQGEMERWAQQIAANRLPYDMASGLYGGTVNQYTGVAHPSLENMYVRGLLTSIPTSMQGFMQGGTYGAIGGGLSGWAQGMYG